MTVDNVLRILFVKKSFAQTLLIVAALAEIQADKAEKAAAAADGSAACGNEASEDVAEAVDERLHGIGYSIPF